MRVRNVLVNISGIDENDASGSPLISTELLIQFQNSIKWHRNYDKMRAGHDSRDI